MKQTREIKNFIYSQYFTDGLRITFGVLLPPLIFSQAGHLDIGITVSLGAITTSIPDTPGPVVHKRNGMMASIGFMLFTALLTGLINHSPVLVAMEVLLLSFFYSMFNVYGNRASSVGTGVLIVMILNIEREFSAAQLFQYCGFLLLGGIWYMALSVAISMLQPYRIAQQALGESIEKVADYLRLKARFYNPVTDLDLNYKKLVEKQIDAHQQQDVVREILFKNKLVTKNPSDTARLLVLLFSDIVDLFEQSMATHYDYRAVRERFEGSSVLREFQTIIQNIGDELENLGHAVTANERPKQLHNFQNQLEQLKYHIDMVDNNLILKKILINVRNIINRIQSIYGYFREKKVDNIKKGTEKDLDRFVSRQAIDPKSFVDNLSLKSNNFRHALRVSIVCVLGYIISTMIGGSHSYWVLLTIVVILKPAFSLTKERNYQRLIGTFVGGIVGALVIYYVKDPTQRFLIMLVFMIGAYSFQRLNYVVTVLFMTPFILIMLSFIGYGSLKVVEERIIDTFIGSFIALVASYFVFPAWEYFHLRSHMRKLLIANYHYLAEIALTFTGKELDVVEYKLARKEVYVQSANMGSVLQRMLSEPKDKQMHVNEVNNFIVLNHSLSSYIATLATHIKAEERQLINPGHVKTLRKALFHLCESIAQLQSDNQTGFKEIDLKAPEAALKLAEESPDSRLITEQLDFISKASSDLLKITQKVSGQVENPTLEKAVNTQPA
ncbi:FUSC family protein [Desertivirga arenae]|uniref:FUSC family protein n=1 Tax=Desertivirga arenae TaxID=2810309 RepID=UPI001A97AA81|nr:FUSC family membrane protein [Pedobacter sp. SYSU D00823]